MPRGSKQQKARQNNLQKARNAYRATVEEVSDEDVDHQTSDTESNIQSQPDNHCNDHLHSTEGSGSSWDIDLGNELPDIDCENIFTETQEPDLDEEIVVAPEISEESELDAFSQFLSNAQVTAQKAERAREKGRTRPKHYSGNAPRTLRRHKKKGKDLKQAGFLSVHDFIKAKQAEKAAKPQNRLTNGDVSWMVTNKHDFSFEQAKIEMDISPMKRCLNTLIMQLIFLRERHRAWLLACFSLIMLQLMSNELQMLCLPVKWSRTLK
jgi:hypothetical protein